MKSAAVKSHKERRQGQKAVPNDILDQITAAQRQALIHLKSIGWSIQFVRRPLLEDQLIVVSGPNGEDHAILDREGNLDQVTVIKTRASTSI